MLPVMPFKPGREDFVAGLDVVGVGDVVIGDEFVVGDAEA